MLTRVLLIALLVLLAIRALGRLFGGVVRGLTPPAPPNKGVQMVRDPVCGTFVVPSRSLMLTDGHEARFFCSEKCRAAYNLKKSGRSVR